MCLGRHCRGHLVHVCQVGRCPHICPWVGPHALSFERQLWGPPSCVEYHSPQGVLLPLVYDTTASPLWFELRGHSAWQATPSWTVYRLACHRLLPWLRVTFAMVPDAAWPGSDQWPWSTAPAPGPVGRPGRPGVSNPWGVGSFLSLVRPMCARCPGPLGSCSPVRSRGSLCRVCGVLGHLAPVHRCARSVWCVAHALSRAPWLPFTSVPAECVVLRVWCPGSLGSCSPARLLRVLLCVRGVLGHLGPFHRCACSVFCFVSAVSWATWLLFTGVSCGLLCCLCGVPGHLAPVHRCVCLVCCVACVASWAPWPPLTGVPARCVVLRVRCPGPLGFCSPVRSLGVLLCVRGVPGLLALVHRCARPWCLVPLLPSVHASVRCSGPRGARSPVCALCAVRVCHWWFCPSSPPPKFSFDEKKRKTGARVHCRHRHGQLVRRCSTVVSPGVCRRCCGAGRAPGWRLARPDVHGYGPGWVRLGVSLPLELAG